MAQRLPDHAVPLAGHQRSDDEYGGRTRRGARFVLEIVRAIRREVGDDYHLQLRSTARTTTTELLPWEKAGNQLDDTTQICRSSARGKGVDAFHVTRAHVPAPAEPGRHLPDRGVRAQLRHHDPERHARRRNDRIFKTWPLKQALRTPVGEVGEGPDRGHQPRGLPRRQARR